MRLCASPRRRGSIETSAARGASEILSKPRDHIWQAIGSSSWWATHAPRKESYRC